jgi:hypothetical protein
MPFGMALARGDRRLASELPVRQGRANASVALHEFLKARASG